MWSPHSREDTTQSFPPDSRDSGRPTLLRLHDPQLPQNHGDHQITDPQAKQSGDLQYWPRVIFTESAFDLLPTPVRRKVGMCAHVLWSPKPPGM